MGLVPVAAKRPLSDQQQQEISGSSRSYLRLLPKQLHCRVQVGEGTDAETSDGASIPSQPSLAQSLHRDLRQQCAPVHPLS